MSDKQNTLDRDIETLKKVILDCVVLVQCTLFDFSNYKWFHQQRTGLALFPQDRKFQETVGDSLKHMVTYPTIAAEVLKNPEIKKAMDYFAKKLVSKDSSQPKSEGK